MSTEAHHQVIAVTGSIGSGKSTACKLLSNMGACVVSADDLARKAVLPGSPALEEIAARFGAKVLNSDGSLNRRALGSIVFENHAALRELEAFTHPRIAQLAEQEFAQALKSRCLLVVYDCPLLFEVGLEKRGFKAVVLIAADEEVSLERVTARDGISRE